MSLTLSLMLPSPTPHPTPPSPLYPHKEGQAGQVALSRRPSACPPALEDHSSFKEKPLEDSPIPQTPLTKRANYPNLLRAPHAPAAGRGRLQRQINRCFVVFGPEVTSSWLYDWCYARNPGARQSQGHRWSVLRILRTVAAPIGRAETIGRPVLWRLKTSTEPAKPDPPGVFPLTKGRGELQEPSL
jgi:hypothetical protein